MAKQAKAKATKPRKKKQQEVEEDIIILNGNAPVTNIEAPAAPKVETPQLQVTAPATPKQEPVKEVPVVVISEEARKLRPEGIYGDDNETAPEMGDRLQKIADNYKLELEKINDTEELKKKEQEWIDKLEQLDKYLEKVQYNLPKTTVFNFHTYQKGVIAQRIIRFIQTKDVQFQFTLGMWELCKLWLTDPSSLTYSQYNATLETLGTLTFKGMSEWENILIINEFFRATNKEYAKDLTAYQYLSTMHSNLVQRLQMIEPLNK